MTICLAWSSLQLTLPDEFLRTLTRKFSLRQWSLVCDRASEAHALQSLFMAGNALGTVPIGPLADAFGRRKLVLIMFSMQAVLMFALVLAPNYGTFAVLR